MDGLPTGPWFPRKVRFDGTGVDFLGLRAVNMRLIDNCLPGISNVTYSIRCYSVASWMWWKARELLQEEDTEGRRSGEMRGYSERVETLFAWGHRACGYKGAPGSRSGPPSAGAVPLDFRSWNRTWENTSIMAAVRYGPSVKTTGGLGFLQPAKGGTFAATKVGADLALALDARLRPLPAYKLLDGLDPVRGREKDAVELVDGWRVGEATADEIAAFRSAFYRPQDIGTAARSGRRTESIELVLYVLQGSPDPMDADVLRRSLTTGRRPDGTGLAVPPQLAMARERWLAMQTRQLQRLALEALLTWSEGKMIRHHCRRLEELRSSLLAAVEAAVGLSPDGPCGSVLDAALSAFDSGKAVPEVALFEVWNQLADALRTSDGERTVGAALAAFRCVQAIVRGLLERAKARAENAPAPAGGVTEDEIVGSCRLGGTERLSLSHFSEWLAAHEEVPASTVAIDLLETHVLSRHLAVGVGRFDGERQRLRFTLEEEGLEPLVRVPLVPSVTEDRLEALLFLMTECGLVECTDAGEFAAAR